MESWTRKLRMGMVGGGQYYYTPAVSQVNWGEVRLKREFHLL
jgi:hypothetical protein